MSLYNLAAGLFEDIEKARALNTTTPFSQSSEQPTVWQEVHDRSYRLEREDGIAAKDEVPCLQTRRRWDNSGSRDAGCRHADTPTLELLEGCLHDIQKDRCGSKTTVDGGPTFRRENTNTTDDEVSLCHENSRKELTSIRHNVAYMQPPKHREMKRDLEGEIELAEKTCTSSRGPLPQRHDDHGVVNSTFRRGQIGLSLSAEENGRPTNATGPRNRDENNTVAAQILSDFERECEDWTAAAVTTAQRRNRMQFASYLSDKYLCDSLDMLPSSVEVCRTRREVARRIDSLATDIDKEDDGACKVRTNSPVDGIAAGGGDSMLNALKDEDNGTPTFLENFIGREIVWGTDAANRGAVGDVESVAANPNRGIDTSISSTPKSNRVSPVAEGTAARKQGVRFLLEASSPAPFEGSDKKLPSGLGVKGRLKGAEAAKNSHDIIEGNTDDVNAIEAQAWICAVCDKKNEPIREECMVCRRRRRRTSGTDNNILPTHRNPGRETRSRQGSATIGGRRRDSAGGESAVGDHSGTQPLSSKSYRIPAASTRSSKNRQVAHGAANGKEDGLQGRRDVMGGGYDFSAFARMRQTTEPVVKARLGLTGEIKSLLNAIRGR